MSLSNDSWLTLKETHFNLIDILNKTWSNNSVLQTLNLRNPYMYLSISLSIYWFWFILWDSLLLLYFTNYIWERRKWTNGPMLIFLLVVLKGEISLHSNLNDWTVIWYTTDKYWHKLLYLNWLMVKVSKHQKYTFSVNQNVFSFSFLRLFNTYVQEIRCVFSRKICFSNNNKNYTRWSPFSKSFGNVFSQVRLETFNYRS